MLGALSQAIRAMARILTVDPSATLQDLLGSVRAAGHEVVVAEDRIAALDLARRTTFDLVLVDIDQPRVDSLVLLRALRAQQDYRSTPLVLLTSERDRSGDGHYAGAGATGWIVKPFDPEHLNMVVCRVLG